MYAGSTPILELGSGRGLDTEQLTSYGFEVVATDLRVDVLRIARDFDGCYPLNVDHSSGLPFRDKSFGFVLASLCLHYFSWDKTMSIIDEISRVMVDDGMLLLRVNSTDDVNFGAGLGAEIDKNYCIFEGQKKRFFEKEDVESMLARMLIKDLWHETIDRYGQEKHVWVAQAVNIKSPCSSPSS